MLFFHSLPEPIISEDESAEGNGKRIEKSIEADPFCGWSRLIFTTFLLLRYVHVITSRIHQ